MLANLLCDIHAGTITERVGNPTDTEPWEWRCGFYPGSRPGEHQSGTAASFAEARADFEDAWKIFLSNRTEVDFQAWRDARDWTERNMQCGKGGEKLPSQIFSSMMTCPCGVAFDSHNPEGSYVHRVHIYAKQAAEGIPR